MTWQCVNMLKNSLCTCAVHPIQSLPGDCCQLHHTVQVEVEIETMDKGGTFLGTVRVPGGSRPFNLGPALLESGLAKLHPSFDGRSAGGHELVAAQEHAQSAQLKVCHETGSVLFALVPIRPESRYAMRLGLCCLQSCQTL